MQVKLFNIDYDLTDSGLTVKERRSLKLPSSLVFEVDNDFDAGNEGADLISDHTGWCVNSFEFELVS